MNVRQYNTNRLFAVAASDNLEIKQEASELCLPAGPVISPELVLDVVISCSTTFSFPQKFNFILNTS